MIVITLNLNFPPRGVCIPVSGALTVASIAQPSPQQFFCICVDSLLPPAAELLCLNSPAALRWHFCVVSFPRNRVKPGKLSLKRGGKDGSCTASAAESGLLLSSPPCAVCRPLSNQPCSCTNKGGFSSFLLQDWKICSFCSRENFTPVKFPIFLSRLCSVLGRDWRNLRWPRREKSRDLCLHCLNS